MSTSASRPKVATLINTLAPHAVHLNEVLAAGLPEIELYSLTSHRRSEFYWGHELPAEIHPVDFSAPDDMASFSYRKSLMRAHIEAPKARRIAEFLIQGRFAALVTAIPSYLSYFLLMRQVARAGIPIFVRSDANIHNEDGLSSWQRWLKKRYYASWMRYVSGVMPMGELGRQFFAQYWNRPDRVYRVPCWPDFDLFSRRNEQALTAFRNKVGLRPGRRGVLYTGRLVRVKRVDLLIDAFAEIAADRPDWDLVIVGAGPLEQDLRRRVPVELRPRVFWPGFLDADELAASYHATDALVLPSSFEPWALVLQEALAAGRPVVSSDIVGAAPEVLIDGQNGRLFRSGDVGSLTTALLDVTDAGNLPRYQAATAPLLEQWKRSADPVPEVRRALTDVGVLAS